jgi:hypothetical protein
MVLQVVPNSFVLNALIQTPAPLGSRTTFAWFLQLYFCLTLFTYSNSQHLQDRSGAKMEESAVKRRSSKQKKELGKCKEFY